MTDRKITSQNLYLLLPGKVSRMAVMYASDFGLTITEALNRIYRSETYRQLEDEETKLWHYGPVALYQLFLEQDYVYNKFMLEVNLSKICLRK